MLSTDYELLSLVRAVGPDRDDPGRAAIADWLDRYPTHQRTPVRLDPPGGFSRWFHRHVLPRSQSQRLPYPPVRGRWDATRIRQLLLNAAIPGPGRREVGQGWYDHGGFTTVAGRSVLVGEPNWPLPLAFETAAALHRWLGCPVTVDGVGRQGPMAVRIAVWYDLADDPLIRPVPPLPDLTAEFVRTHLTADPGGSVVLLDAWSRYCAWMRTMAAVCTDHLTFGRAVRQEFPESIRRRMAVVGVRWTPHHEGWLAAQTARAADLAA